MSNNLFYSPTGLMRDSASNGSEGTLYYEACENSFEIEQERKGLIHSDLNSIIYHHHNNNNNKTNNHSSNFNSHLNQNHYHSHPLKGGVVRDSNYSDSYSSPNKNQSHQHELSLSNIFSDTNSQCNDKNAEDAEEEEQQQQQSESNHHSIQKKSKSKPKPKNINSNINYPSPIHNSNQIHHNLFNTNSVNENISAFFPLKISTINFKLNLDQIDLLFMKSRRRTLTVKSKSINNENKNCRTLLELQNFYLSQYPIWAISISHDGSYIAIGTKKGKLFILEVMNYTYNDFQSSYNQSNIMTYLNFVNEKPKRMYYEHTEDIIDINWSPYIKTQLLTASIDHYVIQWDITQENSIRRYHHDGIVTSVTFHPLNPKAFASGCLDKIVRLWSTDSNNTFEYFNIKEKIISIAFAPNGEAITVGTHNGKIIIYDLLPKLLYNCSFSCKNRIGKNSFGKKVTCIEFCDKNTALITTSDSRIRLMTIPDGKMIHKYKGHKNEEGIIRAHCDNMNDIVISPSEDGHVYLWNKYNKDKGYKKNYGCEYFKAFPKEIVQASRIPSDACAAGFIKKVYKATNKIFVFNIIINGTNRGRMQILLNVEETNSK